MDSRPLALLTENLDIHRHSDWVVFADRLETAIQSGRARRIQAIRKIYAPSEEWFVDTTNGEVYVYLRPDDRVLPEWSVVNVFDTAPRMEPDPKSIADNGLSAIPTGIMDRARGESLSFLLGRMVRQHVIEVVPISTLRSDGSEHFRVSMFRDLRTDNLYELVQHLENGRCSWHPVPNSDDAEQRPTRQ